MPTLALSSPKRQSSSFTRFIAVTSTAAMTVPTTLETKNGNTNPNSVAAVLFITRYAMGNDNMPPITDVPESSPKYAAGSRAASVFFANIQWNAAPARNAPAIDPG